MASGWFFVLALQVVAGRQNFPDFQAATDADLAALKDRQDC